MVWMKKSSGRKPGYHSYTDEDIKRVSWCMDNGIKIAVIPKGTKWQVELSINKNIHLDSNTYEANEACKKTYEYYKYYYDKHNKQ
jgi:ABC-type branched-subunit amino acid transport system ATPase component